MSIIDTLYQAGAGQLIFDKLTIGFVVDTNDPQQMGRIRVRCPMYNELDDVEIEKIPWAQYLAPLAGQINQGTRGPGNGSSVNGVTAYGMWGLPKVGARVIIACVDGNPNVRVCLGCLYDRFTPHSLPHGRFLDDQQQGPISTQETDINPLSQNYSTAFAGDKSSDEWKTRAADFSAAAIDKIHLGPNCKSSVPDQKSGAVRQGYSVSRIDPNKQYPQYSEQFRQNLDSSVYSWTTPGFHALSMDDRPENCRMRFRTAAGHQIIMDDTNERIYIMTAKGNNYIEMDQNGNIDIYSERRVSVHSKKDINLSSDETVRLHGKKGIHMSTEGGDIRMHAKDASIHATTNNMYINTTTLSWTTETFDLKSTETMNLETGASFHMKGGDSMFLTTGNAMNIKGGSNVLLTGSAIHLNGPPATSADAADVEDAKPSLYTNRVPEHEPWARVVMSNPDTNTSHSPEPEANAGQDGVTTEGNDTIERGKFWRR